MGLFSLLVHIGYGHHWDIGKLTTMIDVNLIGALHTLDVILPIFLEKNRVTSFHGKLGRISWIARRTWVWIIQGSYCKLERTSTI